MSNTEAIGLEEQAVKLPGWKWAPRTRTVEGWSVLLATLNLVTLWHPNCPYYTLPPSDVAELCGGLDLSDPATGGILFSMLGEGWIAENDGISYSVYNHAVIGVFCYKHFAEACVRAAIALGGWPEAP